MAVLQTLQRTNWNKQEAAQILGLYRPTLYSKIKKHHIKDPRASSVSNNRVAEEV
jgi:transcriptional regulator of acetoin/glycerol metabolism